MELTLKGDVVDNDMAWLYDWLGMDCVSPKAVADGLKAANGDPLTITLSSYGGDVFAGSEIYTALRDYQGDVTVNITGIAASAASVIAMGGDTVRISPTAQFMIHNASGAASGNNRDMAKMADILTRTNQSIANAYMEKTGMTQEKLLGLMDQETWLIAEEAVKYGFADEIMFVDQIDDLQVVNSARSLPSKSAVKHLHQLISAVDQPQPKVEQTDTVLQEKLKILRGEQDVY